MKERDLKLMASISPEQYLNFERLRRDRSAKVIQNAWRSNVDRKQCEGAIDGMRGSKSSAAVRRSVQRFAKQYKNTKKKPNVKEESVDKPDILDGSPLESFLRESIKDNAKLFPRSDELPGKHSAHLLLLFAIVFEFSESLFQTSLWMNMRWD